MRILLIGEYSNLHWTLAEGLRILGHEVTVASGGDRFKKYTRNIDIERHGYGLIDSIKYGYNLVKIFNRLRGYDIVQLINPIFLDIKAKQNLRFYRYLRKYNKKIFLGAFGTDYFSIKTALDHTTFRYSEYFIGDQPTNFPILERIAKDWLGTAKENLNKEIAGSCNGIIACLYEYYMSYIKEYSNKLKFIPEPINTKEISFRQREFPQKVKFFIGIQTERTQLKGTDILYKVLQKIQRKYPDQCEIIKAESLPYQEYIQLMNNADVLVDQLYSYTPAMNAFIGMAKGMIVVGGGEPESYEILNETENMPVINVLPDENDIFEKLEQLVLHKEIIPELSLKSRQFIEKHHDYVKIARQYVDFWESK